MPDFEFTIRAVKDLANIWNYTFDNWSERQADKYYQEILDECHKLSHSTKEGKSYPNITPNLRGVKVNKHIIFYC